MAPEQAAAAFRDCRRELIDSFTTYDQTVDIVSSWQALLSQGYAQELTCFDRYPELGPTALTPDFAALFMRRYGIIFEIKRSFPREPVAIKKELDQLKSYDVSIPFKASPEGELVTPETHDIVLIISPDVSGQVSTKIKAMVQGGDLRFDRNLIIVEYFFEGSGRVSSYVFRKFPGYNGSFRDLPLPHDRRFEVIMGEQGKPFRVSVSQFMPTKLKEVLCNDQPPPLYLAVYLWNNVFYNFLTVDQRDMWRQGYPTKILPINIELPALVAGLKRDYLPLARIRQAAVRNSLTFLAEAGLAEYLGEERWRVGYSNRTMLLGARRFGEPGEEEHDMIREYAGMLAERYCRTRLGSRAGEAIVPKTRKGRQATLEEKGVPGN